MQLAVHSGRHKSSLIGGKPPRAGAADPQQTRQAVQPEHGCALLRHLSGDRQFRAGAGIGRVAEMRLRTSPGFQGGGLGRERHYVGGGGAQHVRFHRERYQELY